MRKPLLIFQMLIFTSILSFASDSTATIRLERKVDSLQSIIKQSEIRFIKLDKKFSETEILKEFERITEEAYNRKYQISDMAINTTKWLATIVLGILAIVLSGAGFYYSKMSNKIYNEKITEFKSAIDKRFISEVSKIEIDFSNKLRVTLAAFYYQNGMSLLRKNSYDLAVEYFEILYKSKNYRFDDVVYHIAECYLFVANINPDKLLSGKQKVKITGYNLSNIQTACKYLAEAKENTTDSNKLKAINTLLRELDCGKL